MSKDLEKDLFPDLRWCIVDSVSPEDYRCSVRFPDSFGGAHNVIISVSPNGGSMPINQSWGVLADSVGLNKVLVASLGEIDNSPRATDNDTLDREVSQGLLPSMDPGEAFLGRFSRVTCDTEGNIIARSMRNRARIELKEGKGICEASGYKLDFFTYGKAVRVYTGSSLPAVGGFPTMFDDELFIEINAPLPAIPDSEPDVIPTNITRLGFLNSGSVELDVANISKFHIDSLGNIELSNSVASITAGSSGDIKIQNSTIMQAMDVDGDYSISGPSYSLSMSKDGDISIGNGPCSLTLSASGESQLSVSGDIKLGAVGNFEIAAQEISLGSLAIGHIAIAENFAAIWAAIDAMRLALATHTHTSSTPGNETSPSAAIVTSFAQPQFVSLGAASNIGSLTAKVQP